MTIFGIPRHNIWSISRLLLFDIKTFTSLFCFNNHQLDTNKILCLKCFKINVLIYLISVLYAICNNTIFCFSLLKIETFNITYNNTLKIILIQYIRNHFLHRPIICTCKLLKFDNILTCITIIPIIQ